VNKDVFKKLPKIDLHCHLDGSIRTPTIIELAKMQNHPLPATTAEELRPYVRVPQDCKSLGDFLKRFEVFYPLLKNTYALERIAYELCRDCSAENVKYIEIRFAPVLQRAPELPISKVVEAVLKGIKRGQKDYPIKAGVILCLYRGTSLEDSIETAQCAVNYKNEGVCGVDVAGDESRFPLRDFQKPIEMCKKEGMSVTIHAGEASGPDSIRAALDMGADRIGHGITLIQDRDLMEKVAEKKVPLELCLTSNVHTQVVGGYDLHPVRTFIENGVNVTLNTDDRGVSGIDLTYEFEKAHNLGIPMDLLVEIINNGISAAFLSSEEKEGLRQTVTYECMRLNEEDSKKEN
jgi:adenosine deaminase